MKTLFLFLIAGATVAAIGCGSQDKTAIGATSLDGDKQKRDSTVLADTASYSAIQWLDSTQLNLGKIKEGQMVDVRWRFKNAGTTPLIITNVSAGCGCTASAPPKEPIAPGKEGVIEAKFNSKGQTGTPTKSVTVEANTKERVYHLTFTGEVAAN
jgi:hypothetical protein